jgi:hypothetical protein
MHAQELVVHDRGQRQAVKARHERVVHAQVVLDLACIGSDT